MAVLDLFSTRQKRERCEAPDVFVYDRLPEPLRVQVIYILQDALGTPSSKRQSYETPAWGVYQIIVDHLCRHFGCNRLANGLLPDEQLANFLLLQPTIERCLDAIEVSCRAIEQFADPTYRYAVGTKLGPAEAIADLNHRFLEHGVGYQYASGKIIRTDSQYLHAQAIKPALDLLQDGRYKGANEEFLKAHEYYRKDEAKDCLVYCLKALESTLKTICSARGWTFKPTDTASGLFEVCFKNGLVPTFLQSHYSALRNTLESGVPPVRNKLGGHGQGTQVVTVPPHYAAYALHMTGSAIQFLVEAEKNLP